jgi:2-oxoglutarate dehydrogenase E2 component (dihydrolipoamide succinyltransferase)
MSSVADIVAPANAEGTKATILKWCKSVGESVVKDEPLIELETDKVTVEIASPATGRLVEIVTQSDQEVTPGDVLGRISAGGADDAVERTEALVTPPMADVAGEALPPRGASRQSLSPSVRRLLAQHELAPDTISGSGRNGRITAQDVMRHAEKSLSQRAFAAAACGPRAGRARGLESGARYGGHACAAHSDSPPHRRTHGTQFAGRAACHHAVRSGPHPCHGASQSACRRVRKAQGARLTLTAYFIAACARALRAVPEVNATFHQDAMELHADANIGIGTALGNKGLIVPVLRQVQTLNLFGIAQRLSDVVERARTGKLAPEEVRGGTFTISNHGVGGSLLAAPIIINQPQVAILGVGKLERRVCAVDVEGVESISIRSMCYLTLSIDHRALDAFQANAFLSHVVATLESWAD